MTPPQWQFRHETTGSDMIATVNYHSSFFSHGAPSTHSQRILPFTTGRFSSTSTLRPTSASRLATVHPHIPGATGSDLIATVNCHSIFSHQCCPPPWTNIPPRQFHRAHASLYQPTTQSPSFHQPRHTRHTLHFSILSILSKTSTHSTQSTRLSSSLFVYLVYFVVNPLCF